MKYNPDGRLSPDEFLKAKDKIVNLVYAMHRDLLYDGDNKKAQKDFFIASAALSRQITVGSHDPM